MWAVHPFSIVVASKVLLPGNEDDQADCLYLRVRLAAWSSNFGLSRWSDLEGDPTCMKHCKSWDIYHINWLAGFLNHQQYFHQFLDMFFFWQNLENISSSRFVDSLQNYWKNHHPKPRNDWFALSFSFKALEGLLQIGEISRDFDLWRREFFMKPINLTRNQARFPYDDNSILCVYIIYIIYR